MLEADRPDEGTQQPAGEGKQEPEAKAVRIEPTEEKGQEQAQAQGPMRLYRSREHRVIAGVAGGIGEYLGIDPTIIRLLWVLAVLAGGVGILAYILAWIIIPERPVGEKAPQVPRSSVDASLIIGLFLVGLGIWFLLTNLNIIPAPFFIFVRILRATFWPVLLVIIGVFIIIAATRRQPSKPSGGVAGAGAAGPTAGRETTTQGGTTIFTTEGKTLYRSRTNRVIAGVAGGLAEYLNVDPTLIRLAWAVIFIINFPVALIAYVIMAIALPEAPVEPQVIQEQRSEAEKPSEGPEGKTERE